MGLIINQLSSILARSVLPLLIEEIIIYRNRLVCPSLVAIYVKVTESEIKFKSLQVFLVLLAVS